MSMQATLFVYGALMLALVILVHMECVRRRKGLNPKLEDGHGARISYTPPRDAGHSLDALRKRWATVGERTRKSNSASDRY